MSPFKSLRVELTRNEFARIRNAATGGPAARNTLNAILNLEGDAAIPDLAKVEIVIVRGEAG